MTLELVNGVSEAENAAEPLFDADGDADCAPLCEPGSDALCDTVPLAVIEGDGVALEDVDERTLSETVGAELNELLLECDVDGHALVESVGNNETVAHDDADADIKTLSVAAPDELDDNEPVAQLVADAVTVPR